MIFFDHITFLTGDAFSSCAVAAATLIGFGNDDFNSMESRNALTAAAAAAVAPTDADDVFVPLMGADVVIVDVDRPRDCGPVTSAKPRTCSNWAVFRKSLNCSWPMCTSPLYMKRNKLSTSSARTSRNITMGCSHGLAFNNFLKYGLHALNTTLCAVNDPLSQANVTSTKSSSSRKCRNDDNIELWKSFHFNEYCCSDGDGDTGGSIFVVAVLLFSVVCSRVDSVISFYYVRECEGATERVYCLLDFLLTSKLAFSCLWDRTNVKIS